MFMRLKVTLLGTAGALASFPQHPGFPSNGASLIT